LVKIRLRRIGAKKTPSYRIVVADSRAPRDGAFIAAIGHYNPLTDPETIVIDQEKALGWIKQGAQPTDTAARLLAKAGIIEEPISRKEKMKAGTPKAGKKKRAKAAEATKAKAAETPKAEAVEEPKAEVTEAPKDETAVEEPEAATTETPEAGLTEEAEASATEEPKASKEEPKTAVKAEPATSEEPAEPTTETSEEPS
jgi:small subunit ribosomal protein S16